MKPAYTHTVTLNLFQGLLCHTHNLGLSARWMLNQVQHDGFGEDVK
jgi:hypothetical protein